MQLRSYERPATLEEAYRLLMKGKSNRILGGCTFLKRQDFVVAVGIDLQDCGLDYIKADADTVRIGAYTSLREIETSELLQGEFDGMLTAAVEHLIGVQLRNMITIGGHVASRFGFSDLIPTLLALNASVRFYHGGTKTLQAYLQQPKAGKDILLEIILPREQRRGRVQMMRPSYNDYSLFCLAVTRGSSGWIVAAGVRPGRARLAEQAMARMNERTVTRKEAPELAERICGEFRFGTNYRATAEYRQTLCRVFARRAIEVLADDD